MRIRSPVTALGVFVAAAVAVGLVMMLVQDTSAPQRQGPGAAAPLSKPGSTEPSAPKATGPSVTVVKIDNVSAARPQTGIAAADVVYVEPVEGGLTRLVAVYFGEPPKVVGPVRSARQSDVELLAQFGTPVFAYSGVAPELLSTLNDAPLRLASPEQLPGPYFRTGRNAAPHNLYVTAAALPEAAAPALRDILRFGPAPRGGTATSGYSVRYRAATFGFRWSRESARWLISTDGTPMTSVPAGRLSASSVVVQQVPTGDGMHIADASGAVSPVVSTVGSAGVTILRDGMKFTGTWTRPEPAMPTRYRTDSGQALPLAEGPVWVLLVPR